MKFMPILYEATEQNFDTNGLGRLTALTACTVTQGMNEDSYDLEATYPVNAPLYDQIQVDRIIYATSCKKMFRNQHWDNQIPQPFRIYSTSKDMVNGLIDIKATHAALHMMHGCVTCPGAVSGTAIEVMEALKDNAITNGTEWPFGFVSYINDESSIDFSEPVTLYDVFFDEDGGILARFGARILFNKYDIILVPISDDYTGTTIQQGKNMSSLEIVSDASDVITGVVPYYTHEDDDGNVTTVYADPKVVSFDDFEVAHDHLLPIDCTSDIETPDWAGDEWLPDPGDLVEYGEDYLRANYDNYIPTTYASGLVTASDIITGDIVLGDVVAVISKSLQARTVSRVTGTVYNCLTDTYDSVTVGKTKSNLAQTIVDLTTTTKKTEKSKMTARRGTSGEWTWTYNKAGNEVDTCCRHPETNRACKKTSGKYRSALITVKIPDLCSSFRGWKWELSDCRFLSSCEYTGTVEIYKHTSKTVSFYIYADYTGTGSKCYLSGTVYIHFRQNSGSLDDKYYLPPVDVTFDKSQYWYADCLGKNKGPYARKKTVYSCLGHCQDMYACVAKKSTYYVAGFAYTGTSEASIEGGQPWTSAVPVKIYRESKYKTTVGTIPANTQCDCIAVLGNAFLIVWKVDGEDQDYHRIGWTNVSGGILVDDYDYYWDLTSDLNDTVNDTAITLHGSAYHDSDGVHLDTASDYITIDGGLLSFENRRVVIEFGECVPDLGSSNGILLRFGKTASYSKIDNGMTYHTSSSLWQVYKDGSWITPTTGIADADAISNTTVELICVKGSSNDGKFIYKIGDSTVLEQDNITTDYVYFSVGTSSNSYHGAVIRSIKVYPYSES